MNSIQKSVNIETVSADEKLDANIAKDSVVNDMLTHVGKFTFTCNAPVEERRDEFIGLRDRLFELERTLLQLTIAKNALESANFVIKLFNKQRNNHLNKQYNALYQDYLTVYHDLKAIPTYVKWEEAINNVITTVGKNNMLDNHYAGSSYTAAWSMGLIDNASFTAVAAADTMASHAGWIESTAYSNANRISAAWSAAAAGVKSLSAALGFSMNATVTIRGGFLCTNNTKGGTTGILNNATAFTGGNQAVNNGDTLNVSFSSTLT